MKTRWTPLTSQEQLDQVWESMEVGSIMLRAIKIKNVKFMYYLTLVKGNDIKPTFTYDKKYTILTTGE